MTSLRSELLLLGCLVFLCGRPERQFAAELCRVGLASYATALPPGAKEPPATIFQTARLQGRAKMPTNDWWSSLAWMSYSERQYPHPLAVQAGPAGLRVYYPGNSITANQAAIFGFMPAGTNDDLVLGHSAEAEFPDARVDGFSDWFVQVRFGDAKLGMTATYGHGSPFVYALYDGGRPRLSFAKAPAVWSGSAESPVLGVTVGKNHYGLFGPTGSTWTGLGTNSLVNHCGAKRHFSIAVLPEATAEALALFQRYAYAHVADTQIAWSYDPQASSVTTTFRYTTTPHEGEAAGTLFALYPHQWRNTSHKVLTYSYRSVRGAMKLGEGTSFATRMAFPGVLPVLPYPETRDRQRLNAYLMEDVRRREGEAPAEPHIRDTYWEGKHLGKLAALLAIAEQCGNTEAVAALARAIRARLEAWFTAAAPDGRVKPRGLFYYNRAWGTLIGYPASYGSDTELNDHHFHYGYFIRAAAEIANLDRAWAEETRWGGLVSLLIRDIASPDRQDPLFPFLRCFDPYAGHSWASGHARFGDGNNNESSSEAMNAWCGIILWGQATGDRAIRDLGIFLYTTEMNAIQEYWFDVHGDNHPPGYTPSVVTMIWGGKGANGTWFTANPEMVHGINWLPFHGGSLYLGAYPDYVRKNYAALVRENKGAAWREWPDLIWMYLALVDPRDALAQFNAHESTFKPEAGNSKANTYYWLHSLNDLGQVQRGITADYPLYACFRKGPVTSYVVYNMESQARTVTFSDGTAVQAARKGFFIQRAR